MLSWQTSTCVVCDFYSWLIRQASKSNFHPLTWPSSFRGLSAVFPCRPAVVLTLTATTTILPVLRTAYAAILWLYSPIEWLWSMISEANDHPQHAIYRSSIQSIPERPQLLKSRQAKRLANSSGNTPAGGVFRSTSFKGMPIPYPIPHSLCLSKAKRRKEKEER